MIPNFPSRPTVSMGLTNNKTKIWRASEERTVHILIAMQKKCSATKIRKFLLSGALFNEVYKELFFFSLFFFKKKEP
jgi:hypothetical protein